MRKLIVTVTVLAALAAGCGDRGDDPSASPGGDGGTDTPGATTPASGEGGDWGDLTGVCGPNEGGGAIPDLGPEEVQGLSEDTITLGTVADPGNTVRPGLNQALFDASDAFVQWCNEQGGINGKQIDLTKRDTGLFEYEPVVGEACNEDFALVGGGAIQDDLWPEVGAACGLIDIAGFAVTPDKAGVANQDPFDTRTIQPLPNASDQFPVGPMLLLAEEFPEAGDRVGIIYGDMQTLIDQKEKEERAYAAIGHTVVHTDTYNLLGEGNWRPFATSLQSSDVQFLRWVGEPNDAGAMEQAMSQVGFVPAVRVYEANFYDPVYLDSAGPAAEGAFVGLSFHPLEEADDNPATALYLENVDKVDGQVSVLGLQSTSAWLLFATAAKECDLENNLSRSCILEKAGAITEWTAGGLHSPSSPGTNEASRCWLVMTVEDGAFTRWGPTDEPFRCDDSFVVDVPA